MDFYDLASLSDNLFLSTSITPPPYRSYALSSSAIQQIPATAQSALEQVVCHSVRQADLVPGELDWAESPERERGDAGRSAHGYDPDEVATPVEVADSVLPGCG